ncbi:hypothetical protein UA45_15245 [Morganella morganii]|uniref:Uncharacterized protein n=1 Tax=Morganella morganii TaxID=582 RepID=A0A0D8L5L7_MORMO|nr:hypothetical protein UA45_15245 [Morganella morganii]
MSAEKTKTIRPDNGRIILTVLQLVHTGHACNCMLLSVNAHGAEPRDNKFHLSFCKDPEESPNLTE